MKKCAWVFAVIVIVVIAWFLLSNRNATSSTHSASYSSSSPGTTEQNAAVARALAVQSSNTVGIIQSNFARANAQSAALGTAVSIPPAGPASPPEITNIPPEIAVENMSRAIRQYGEMFGGNPVGTNPEFTKQLGGDNSRHINFINAEAGMRVNANGELIDPWGTPYFFHQISGSDTEVRSAGPDRIMWTADDIVK